jgi:hypothetical protein
MGTHSLDLECKAATAAGSRGTVLEILPARERKEKFTRMRRIGTANKMGHEPKGAKVTERAMAKAKEKERKAGWATGTPNPCATIGARGMDTAATLQPASSPTMVLKEETKEKEKMVQQHHCRPKP